MKFTSSLTVLAFVATISAFPSSKDTKEFPWNDAVKASIHPEKIESIQQFFNQLQSSGFKQPNMLEENAANEMTEMECISFHLDNINTINTKSGVEVRACSQTYLNTSQALEQSAMIVKVNNDNDKNWCMNDSVTKANQHINAEHEQLLLC